MAELCLIRVEDELNRESGTFGMRQFDDGLREIEECDDFMYCDLTC